MRTKHPFTSEADLCKAFSAWALVQGWKSYAETAGWDILLIGPGDEQFGIQAKLRFNATLLRQALPVPSDYADRNIGPDRRGILLPTRDSEISEVCAAMGIGYFYAGEPPHRLYGEVPTPLGFYPRIDVCDCDWNPAKRCEVPEFVPDVAAGASSPIQLTKWKIAALRVCAALEVRGEITAAEIRKYGIDPRRWMNPAQQWLIAKPDCKGVFTRGSRLNFDSQHPTVYAEIRELFTGVASAGRAE